MAVTPEQEYLRQRMLALAGYMADPDPPALIDRNSYPRGQAPSGFNSSFNTFNSRDYYQQQQYQQPQHQQYQHQQQQYAGGSDQGLVDRALSAPLQPRNQISVSELRRQAGQKEARSVDTFRIVLERVYRLIRRVSATKREACAFQVPAFVLHHPMYDHVRCVEFIVRHLASNGFAVQFVPPSTVLVSWAFAITQAQVSAATASISRHVHSSLVGAVKVMQEHQEREQREQQDVQTLNQSLQALAESGIPDVPSNTPGHPGSLEKSYSHATPSVPVIPLTHAIPLAHANINNNNISYPPAHGSPAQPSGMMGGHASHARLNVNQMNQVNQLNQLNQMNQMNQVQTPTSTPTRSSPQPPVAGLLLPPQPCDLIAAPPPASLRQQQPQQQQLQQQQPQQQQNLPMNALEQALNPGRVPSLNPHHHHTKGSKQQQQQQHGKIQFRDIATFNPSGKFVLSLS